MPKAIRVFDKVGELTDWDQASFTTDGMIAQWNALMQKYVGTVIDLSALSSISLVTGLTTSALTSSGLFGYVSANDTMALTDNLALASSLIFGASTINSGEMIVGGIVSNAKFTTVGGSPPPGSQVYLAASTDEASAAGKLTATVPTSGVLAVVGVCLNDTNYALSKTARILLQVKTPIVL